MKGRGQLEVENLKDTDVDFSGRGNLCKVTRVRLRNGKSKLESLKKKKAKITFYDSKIKSFVDETTNRLGIIERRKQEVRESQQEILNGGEGRGREGG